MRVRFSEPQIVQGSKKIVRALTKVNSCSADVLRRGLQIREKDRELRGLEPVYGRIMTEK